MACLEQNPDARPAASDVLALVDAVEAEPATEPETPEPRITAPPTVIRPAKASPNDDKTATDLRRPRKPDERPPERQDDEELPPSPGALGRRALIITLACSLLVAGIVIPVLVVRGPTGAPSATVPTPTPLKSLDPGDYTAVYAMAFAPGSTTLATGDSDGNTYLWNTITGKKTATLTVPNDEGNSVQTLAFAPNGTSLATGDVNSNTYLWDTATGKITATLALPGGKGLGVDSVAFAPNGTALATGDGDGEGDGYTWDLATGKVTADLGCFDDSTVNAVAFAPNGATVALGCWTGDTQLYRTEPGPSST
jgi:WD40 repeat protein